MDEEQPSPPSNWICDLCGQQIPDPKVGLVIWRRSADRPMHDFKIVHKGMDPWHCWDRAAAAGYSSSFELGVCIGTDGLAWLLSCLGGGPADDQAALHEVAPEDLDDYVDLFRRLQMPFYEQARRKFRLPDVREELAGSNEVYPYTLDTLRWVAEQPLDY